MSRCTRLMLVALLLAMSLSGCQSAAVSDEQRIGRMVQAIDEAIATPDDPESLATVTRYGTDTRYYVMIRGWLVQELKGVESQLEASRDRQIAEKFRQKANFLRTAIRRIDLE